MSKRKLLEFVKSSIDFEKNSCFAQSNSLTGTELHYLKLDTLSPK